MSLCPCSFWRGQQLKQPDICSECAGGGRRGAGRLIKSGAGTAGLLLKSQWAVLRAGGIESQLTLTPPLDMRNPCRLFTHKEDLEPAAKEAR